MVTGEIVFVGSGIFWQLKDSVPNLEDLLTFRESDDIWGRDGAVNNVHPSDAGFLQKLTDSVTQTTN